MLINKRVAPRQNCPGVVIMTVYIVAERLYLYSPAHRAGYVRPGTFVAERLHLIPMVAVYARVIPIICQLLFNNFFVGVSNH